MGGVIASFAMLSVVMAAQAADTHDYSTYIRLKANTSCKGGMPGASAWEPSGVMSNEYCYLVPSGISLGSVTKKDQVGGNWPGQEIAIGGTFSVNTTGKRTYAAVTPHLALLPGGVIAFTAAYSTVNGDTLDIRGTAENPSLIQCSYSSDSSDSLYAKLDIAFTGDEDSVVRFKHTGTLGYNAGLYRAFRTAKNFANYPGTVIVDGSSTWLRPDATFDMSGTLCVTNGAGFYVVGVSPTVGSLVMAEDSRLRIASGRFVTVTNSLYIAESAKITAVGMSTSAIVYDDGSSPPPEIPVLSVCCAANAAAVDRDVLLSAIKSGTEANLFKGGIPRLTLAESVRADGGVDFKASHAPVVKQLKSCPFGGGPYGYDQYEGYLSDGSEISSSKDYYTEFNVYCKSGYVFPGRSLTIDLSGSTARTFGFYSGVRMTVSDLRIIGDASRMSRVRQMSKNGDAYLYGNAAIYGMVNFRVSGSGRFNLDSNLSGSGDIAVTLDLEKIRDPGSDCCGTLSLGGENTAYAGRFLVGCGRSAEEDVEGLTNLTLRATSAASLGGELGAFTFDAVKIADACRLQIADTATFDATNRGWCLMDGASVEVSGGKVATMNGAVTFGGATKKTGDGALIFGGGAKHYDSVNDAATDTPAGESFRIAAGEIGATAADALAGVSLSFADGAGIVALPGTSGLVLSSAPTIDGDTLPIRIVVDGQVASEVVNLLTLPTAAAFNASKLSVRRVRGYIVGAVQSRVEGDSTVYFATLDKSGFMIIVQ